MREVPCEEDFSCFMSDAMPRSLDDIIDNLDETFSEMLLCLIDEKEKSDVEVYKKANIDQGTELNYRAMNMAISCCRSEGKINKRWKEEVESDYRKRK